jgi:hypothetical protein
MARLPRTTLLTLAVLLLGTPESLLLPGSVLAKPKSIAPPGNSSVSQYVEDLPTVRGSEPTRSIVIVRRSDLGQAEPGYPAASGRSALPARVVKQLNRAGRQGQHASATAEATAPPPVRARPTPPLGKRPAPTAGQLLKMLGDPAGNGGFDAFLPVFLIVVLVIVSAVGALKRRRTS